MASEVCRLTDVSVTLSTRIGWFGVKRKQVLDGVDLTLRSGERVGVIGRNGAGKSSLLLVAAGLIKPDSGGVTHAAWARTMLLTLAMGFDNRLTGRMNAMMAAIFLGATAAEARVALPDIIEFAELEDYIDTPLHAYSSGMKARLSFAVSQVLQAELLLIDEMLGVGDEGFREKSSAALRQRLCEDQTVLIVSHNLTTLNELCDRGIWIDGGRIRADGPIAEVIRDYRSASKMQQAGAPR